MGWAGALEGIFRCQILRLVFFAERYFGRLERSREALAIKRLLLADEDRDLRRLDAIVDQGLDPLRQARGFFAVVIKTKNDDLALVANDIVIVERSRGIHHLDHGILHAAEPGRGAKILIKIERQRIEGLGEG